MISQHQDPTRNEVWDAFWAGKQSAEIYPAVSDLLGEILRVLPDVHGRRILEVGAGTGREGHELARRGARVHLMDISPAALLLTRQISAGPLLVRGDATRAPFPDATFDLVYHQGLLEHFRDPLPLLRENCRITKPGGFALIDVPQRYHVYTALKHVLIACGKWFGGWETEYAPRQLERLVTAGGFEITRRFGYAMHPGLTYRLIREVGKKTGCKLPMTPRLGPLTAPYNGWHELLRRMERQRWGHYLTLTVGVLARKPTR